MSLQVWLPLTKDTRNQGLATGTINWTTTASFTNNGKLGKALTTGGCKMPASMTAQVLNNQAVTIACWLFVNADADDSTNRAMIFGNDSMSTLGGRQFSIFRYPNSDDIHLSWQNYSGGTYSGAVVGGVWSGVLTPRAWNHVCVTYQNPNVKIYVNGIQVGTTSGTINADSFAYDTDIIHTSSSHYINDFRIYDHCLSPMEVKELAKGLVLHYPLNRQGWGQENLYTGSRDFSGTWVNGSAWSTSTETYEGFTVKQKSTVWGGLAQNITCSNGDVFTVSFYAKVTSGGNILSIHRSSLGNVTTGLTILGGNFSSSTNWVSASEDGTQWKRYWATVRIDSSDITYLQWRIENSVADKTLYVCGMKLEKGSIATPWCPNSSDALATTMGLNGTTEYDCSGFCNNGTRTGTFSWTSDTPKYSVSTAFSGSQYITEDNEIETTDSTIAAWVKTSLSANAFILDCRNSSGAGKQPIYQYTNGSIQSGGASQYVTTNTGLLVANTWIHLAIVQSGSSLLVYKNGSLFQTLSCTNSPIIKLTVGARYSLSSLLPSGSISDVRIYATALSASDVKSLYQNCATIDPDGTIHGQIRS